MRTELQCLPCFFRQVKRTLHHAGVNGDTGRLIMRAAESLIEKTSLEQAPARVATMIHRMIRERIGADPYKHLKANYNRIVLETLPTLTERLERMAARRSVDGRLESGVRLAIAGNVIDFGIYDEFDLDRSIDDAFRISLSPGDFPAFSRAVKTSRHILYLCDNAGEIVFDRILVDMLRDLEKDITIVVKGFPVINDATEEDAAAAGLPERATVIDNGSDGIGTLLESCSDRFHDAYRSADMIISKGQANYETLSHARDERIFFLFKVKCPVVAGHLGMREGEAVLLHGANGDS